MKNYFEIRNPEHILLQLKDMKELMTFFRKECGVYTYLTYGSLLGAIRERDVISRDTDYDIAYFSKGTTIEEVREELKRICTILVNNKMLGKVWHKGGQTVHPTLDRLYDLSGQMHVQAPNKTIHIDVYTSFCLNGKFHMSYGIHGHLNKSEIVPFGQSSIRGIEFVTPKNPEAILKFMYGKDWKIPQEGYKYKGKFKRLWNY